MQPASGIGKVIAGYRLHRKLGSGGHGTVYLAEHTGTAQAVALKLVPLPTGDDGAAARREFLHHAATAQGLQHPGIVMLHAAGVEGRHGWLAMEPVPGTDLQRYTQPARLLPEALVLRLAERLALALAHAHALGVVHRDIKPANVLVDWPQDIVKLADFGLARTADAEATRTGLMLGSPAYMAPEQLAGAVPDARSDFYALGVTIFELLAGRLPFQGDTMGALLRQVATAPVPDLRELRPGLPAEVAVLVTRLLAREPAARAASAGSFAAEFGAAAARMPR